MNLEDILKDSHITEPISHKPRCTPDGNYYWLKGETIKLTWDVDGDVKNIADDTFIEAEKFMEDKTVRVRMFDYMGKQIKEWSLENPGTTIEIEIRNDEENGDFFARDLKTGTYQISVTVYGPLGMVLELVQRADCIVEVR